MSLEPLLGPVPSLQLSGIDLVIVSGERGSAHSPRLPSPQRCDARPEPARERTVGTPAVPSGDNAVPPDPSAVASRAESPSSILVTMRTPGRRPGLRKGHVPEAMPDRSWTGRPSSGRGPVPVVVGRQVAGGLAQVRLGPRPPSGPFPGP
ncbi:hypothetical protein [Streptomyces canus]|uniref:hypothetical protein n=1 Tax=Streptomyces canus TaxID=58343 RepID=UPI0039A43C0C